MSIQVEQKRRLAQEPGWWGAECANQEVETAPGYQVFLTAWLDGRRQTIAVDPDEVDELTRRLHQAKRISRRARADQEED